MRRNPFLILCILLFLGLFANNIYTEASSPSLLDTTVIPGFFFDGSNISEDSVITVIEGQEKEIPCKVISEYWASKLPPKRYVFKEKPEDITQIKIRIFIFKKIEEAKIVQCEMTGRGLVLGSYSGQPIGDKCWAYKSRVQDNPHIKQIIFLKNNKYVDVSISNLIQEIDPLFVEKVARVVDDKLRYGLKTEHSAPCN
jgi:hypothetical protein